MDIFIRTIVENAPLLVNATLLTLFGSIISIVLAMILAVPTAFMRLSKNMLFRSVSTFYVETIRGTPLLLQLYIWFFGASFLLLYLFNFNVDRLLYNLLTAIDSNSLYPSQGVSNIFFAVVGLSFNYGAYLSEVIRAGIEAVDRGQVEAAQALGLSQFQVARYVTLPQALRIMTPPLTNNFITLIQDSAFWQVLGLFELSHESLSLSLAISNNAVRWGIYSLELAIYFVICYSLAFASSRAEARLARGVAGAN
ncbi:MAG: amino acid ABC transporter permease [Chloroflexota bacterium]|nr:amino acid ABC transporter permease [Chloroflexota bacterium]